MSSVVFELTVSAGERSQTDALYRAASGAGVIVIGHYYCLELKLCSMFLPRWLSVTVQHFTLRLGQDEATCPSVASCLFIALALC